MEGRGLKVAFGWKAHSGWAALVALAVRGDDIEVLDRRRVELVPPGARQWAKQPYHAAGRSVAACAVLVGNGMPDWSVSEILAVHFRMHKAEGELFRDALVRAARACDLRLVEIPERSLFERAKSALSAPASELAAEVAALGRRVGPPWARDQKDAALAARIALREISR